MVKRSRGAYAAKMQMSEEYVSVPRKELERWTREVEDMRRLLRSSDSESRR